MDIICIFQFVSKHLLIVAWSLGNLNYEEVLKDILLVASLSMIPKYKILFTYK